MPTRFFINQCQIITFLIIKSDNKENSRTELKGIVLQVPSNQIKVTFMGGGGGGGGGGGKGYVAPPLSNYFWGGLAPSTPHSPCTFAYEVLRSSIRWLPPNRANGVAVFEGSPIRHNKAASDILVKKKIPLTFS